MISGGATRMTKAKGTTVPSPDKPLPAHKWLQLPSHLLYWSPTFYSIN